MRPVASLAGTTLGRYRLVDKLGQGAMATVYRAEDPQLGREVAIKVMHPFIAERSDMSTRFEREARAVAGLRHPNVLALHDYAPATGEHPAYLVMELLTGPSLHKFLVEHGAPLAEVGAMIGLRLAQALSAAHGRGIVHRDVKPENVMWDHGRIVLCDFGIARIAAAEGMTTTGAIMGSPAYMSPEQASGHEIDVRSDQFSLGAVLYQLATGALPFTAPTPLATMAKIVSGEHRPPTAKNPRVPQYLERVIERCLAPKPEARFPSAEAIANALRDGLAGDGFTDVDAELLRYVREPAPYNAATGPRIIAASLAQAERAAKAGQRARALGAASRVLAWDPKHPQALALADAATPVRARRILFALLPVLLVAGGGAWWLRFQTRGRERSHPLPPASARVGGTGATPPALVRAAPASTPATATPPTSTAATRTGEALHAAGATPAEHAPAAAANVTPADDKAHAGKHHRLVSAAPEPSPSSPAAAPPVAAPAAAPARSDGKPAPAAPAPDAPATLTVAIAPWCDLTVDGQPRGRTPATLSLPPGKHHLDCKNPVSGQSLTRDLELAAGQTHAVRERLYATVRVTPQLARGDEVSIDGDTPSAALRQVEPGRRRVTLLAGGKELETRYIDVPPNGCRLVDKPQLACEKP